MRKVISSILYLLFPYITQAAAVTCDVASPTLPCEVDGMTYDTFAGNYSGNRSFYQASSYDTDISGGYLCLTIKDGLPHNNGFAYVANYGATVWTSPPPYNVNFGIFGRFSGSCIEQANNFEWIAAEDTHVFDYPLGPPDHLGWKKSQAFNVLFPGKGYHLGEDWVKSTGSSQGQPVFATADGLVVAAGTFGSCWKDAVVILHTSTASEPFGLPGGKTTTSITSSYGHLSDVPSFVQVGNSVRKGQQIGVIAPKTSCSTGAHLHFEVRKPTTNQTASMPFGPGPGYMPSKVTGADSWLNPSQFIELNR
jgi:murein DD-endopeptidase MepM/ murein hydrolase activator NlpD